MEPLEFVFTHKGAEQVAAKLTEVDNKIGRVDRALVELDRAQATSATSATRAANAFQGFGRSANTLTPVIAKFGRENVGLGRSLGEVVGKLGIMTQATGKLSPAVQGVSQFLMQAGQSAVYMGASMGPVGVVVAGLTVAIPALVSALSDTEGELKDVGDAAKTASEKLDELIGKMRQSREEQSRETRIYRGRGTAEEQAAAIARQQERIAEIRRKQDELEGTRVDAERVTASNRLRSELSEAERVLRQLQAFTPDDFELRGEQTTAEQRDRASDEWQQRFREQRAEEERSAAEQAERERERAGQVSARNAEAQRRLEIEALEQSQRNINAGRGGTSETFDLEGYRAEQLRSGEKEQEIALARMQERRNDMLDLSEKEAEALRSQTDELTAQQVAVQSLASSIGTGIVSAFEHAAASQRGFLGGLVEGFDIWAEGFAMEELGKGASAAASALGAFFFNPALAAGLEAEAAGHFANAAVFGAAGLAIPSSGRGSASAAASTVSSHPIADSGSSGTGGGNTYVFNVNGGFNTPAETGRALHLALKEAEREGAIPRR